jgi:hypothetical protein
MPPEGGDNQSIPITFVASVMALVSVLPSRARAARSGDEMDLPSYERDPS